MVRDKLINQFITNHVFPNIKVVKEPSWTKDRTTIYFGIRGCNYNDCVGAIHYMDSEDLHRLLIVETCWRLVGDMFNLTKREVGIIFDKWFRKNTEFHFNYIKLLQYDDV